MSKWRELKYYDHGTPTKTAMKYRRRHLFRWNFEASISMADAFKSPCGILVFERRFSEGPTMVPKCGHCAKASIKALKGDINEPRNK